LAQGLGPRLLRCEPHTCPAPRPPLLRGFWAAGSRNHPEANDSLFLLGAMLPPYEAPNKNALFLGYFSFETVMLLILGIHAFCCIFLVANASPVVEISYFGFTLNTTVQTGLASWGLLGIVCIVCALIGWSQQREFPMAVYFFYLLVTTLVVSAFFVWLSTVGWQCAVGTEDLQAQRIGFSFVCTVISSAIVLVGLAVTSGVLFGLYTIYQVQAQIHESVVESLSETSRLLLKEKQDDISKAYWS